jgi:hypothetical protein
MMSAAERGVAAQARTPSGADEGGGEVAAADDEGVG